ncbi:hypothetical protein [Pontibacter actiniarum]|uniref:STAS domain-containing protein n=1 Tax=Pontibacter actiniarum TaxID=323450 RepID=A0A1X9YV04_9BACT|nr:hypothetical protein [Pontibacter actiniarum]ARS36746.1 hypothetical protein CA264_15690 [Pontibacter actiniarum]
MQAFLYIDLAANNAYRKPVVELVQKALPTVTVLDLDSRSDELLQHYALRLLREAERTVVCIKADDGAAGLGNLMPLLEELFQEGRQRLVLLQGEHPRLQRIFSVRPHVAFKAVGAGEVPAEVSAFLL